MSLTRINGEPVKLVESFEELREGMVVWVSPCPAPGCTKHRGMLLNAMPEQLVMSVRSGEPNIMGGVSFSPPVHGGEETMLTEADVVHGAVYRVTDEKLESESQAKSRELERVR